MHLKDQYRGVQEDRVYKIAIITLYTAIILWLCIMLGTPAANGYEISIYGAYSTFFWLLFLFTLFFGIALTIYFIVRGLGLWRYSFPAILIADTVLLLFPLIRNYEIRASLGADVFAHLGWSKYILNTGYIMDSDHYPAMHILMATLDHLSLLDPKILAVIIPFTFFILYIAALFVLGNTIFKDNRAAALLVIFGSPLLFSSGHHAFWPFVFAIFLFPLIFYIMRKIDYSRNRGVFYVCFIVLSLFIVFCHPMTTLVLLLTLGTLYGYSQISNKGKLGFFCKFNILNMATIVGVTFLFWYIRFKSISGMGERVISALLESGDAETILTHNLDLVDRAGISLFRTIEVFIKVYGPMVIYFILALFATIYLAKKVLAEKKYVDEMSYGALYLLSIAFGAALTSGYFIIFELIRAVSFAIIMATIVCGISLYIILKNIRSSNGRKFFTVVAIIILCSVSFLSVLNVYSSPWTMSIASHTTKMEISGIDWFLVKQDESTPLHLIGSDWRKYLIYFQELHKTTIQKPQIILNDIPTHFGYDQDRYLGQSINNSEKSDLYIVTNELMRQSDLAFPEEIQSVRKRYLQEDFSRLNQDPTVNKLYMNREWELWGIQVI